LLEAQHKDLEGLLFLHAKTIDYGDSVDGQNGVSDGIENVSQTNEESSGGSEVTADSNSSSFSLMDNIWAIAAVAALGAMFLTVLACTTILWCDWRKRKAKKEQLQQQKFFKQQQQQQQEQQQANGNYIADNLMHMPTLASEETETPSPSTSDDVFANNYTQSMPSNNNQTRASSIIHAIRKKSVISATSNKSKAAQTHLQQSRSTDDEDPSPAKLQDKAPSVIYSVGEDTTTMLYPAIHRGRQDSRDLSEFDGYSMDGMSAIGGGLDTASTNASSLGKKQHPLLLAQRNVVYSSEVPRDFDSVWDAESKLTASEGGGHERNLSIDDSILGKSIGSEVMTKQPMDEDPIINSTGLNRLDEDGDGGSENFLNEFDDESESESTSNRGAFTLELLKGNISDKSKRKSLAADDDDSILGDIGGRSECVDISTATGMEEVEGEGAKENGEVDANVPGSGESVDSSPSWAGRIKSALMRSSSKTALDQIVNISLDDNEKSNNAGSDSVLSDIFRPTAITASGSVSNNEDSISSPQKAPPTSSLIETASSQESEQLSINNSVLGNQTSPNSVKDKFVSSLSLSRSFSRNNDDDRSVNSSRSAKSSSSRRSNHSSASQTSATSNAAESVKAKQSKALGLTNSMDEEVDEDPADMIENINAMLSECRVILDTDVDGPVK